MTNEKDKALVDTLAHDLFVEAMVQFNVTAIREALMPLAMIATAYEASGLDEARPEWNSHSDPSRVVIYAGRGGRTLLTLADAFAARDALLGVKR